MVGGGGRFGGGPYLPDGGANPPNGAGFYYFGKDSTDSTKLTIEIMDKNKKNIKTFSNTSKENKIEVNKGMNQFVWDINYAEAERIDGLILWNGFVGGPKGAPGQYYAKFRLGNDSTELPFTLLADPNYKITVAEHEE